MWFPPEVLKTEALQKVMFRSRGKVEVELIQILNDLFEEYELTEIEACLNDFIPLLKNAGISYCKGTDIREIFQTKWKLQPIKNSSTYKKVTLTSEGLIYFKPKTKGRYYTIPVGIIDELLQKKVCGI